jgi:predicted NUDIX family phosphoesterase
VDGELVLVVPRAAVLAPPGWHGVRADGVEAVLAAARSTGRYLPRAEVEGDPSYKQLIPYLVLRDGARYFLMRRTSAGGDARLFERYSIGIGGHVEPGDGDLLGGLAREWREEIAADFEPRFIPVGLVNDDTTDVGSVHLGVVFVADVGGRPVAIREATKLSGGFADPVAVRAVRAAMETWSQLVFDAFEAGILG